MVGAWRQSDVIDPTTGRQREISGLRHDDSEIHFTQGLPRWKSTGGIDVFGVWRETCHRFNEVDSDC